MWCSLKACLFIFSLATATPINPVSYSETGFNLRGAYYSSKEADNWRDSSGYLKSELVSDVLDKLVNHIQAQDLYLKQAYETAAKNDQIEFSLIGVIAALATLVSYWCRKKILALSKPRRIIPRINMPNDFNRNPDNHMNIARPDDAQDYQ